ncbi:family 78 glycoside hydrolase catalytic domain [Chitinophaga sp. Cy-1792]|uniref:family 78 glycoside hydrolase catalytic domain n=1 Tax=Chitinophaga sp. Cy-1792 TaxID=2608339 RepID=UPI0014201BE5|nr:family 78 glycoside hydrolase catalytic domain [Chitinophaga sp. Cy-1792]NIG54106.1 Bacterial alpha-L-rhamnosidase [Chitinophaga sp. Cy-1792]
MKHLLCFVTILSLGFVEFVSGQSVWTPDIKWINPGFAEDTVLRSPPVFRKTFRVLKPVKSATLYISAHGVYEGMLNGRRIGDAFFAPGWTSYDTRLQYQQYELGDLIKKQNDLRITVGEGWYRGVFGGLMEKDNYGHDAGIICRIDIRYKDGSADTIISDTSWQSSTGPIRHSDIYGGETYDANIQPDHWYGVRTGNYSTAILVPAIGQAVRKHETFKPVKVWTTPAGDQVIDFGQNLAGWVQCRLHGNTNDTVVLQHAEMLDKAGNFYTGNLREAKATDTYILKKGTAVYEPHFTWHGFRYVKVSGVKVQPADFTAVALYTDITPAGTFSCSDTMLNKLQHNITWSLKGNFLDIPTDCPQRSERLGWTGDAQVFFRTAAFNFDVSSFYEKWLQDLKADQRDNGSVPAIIPNIYRNLQPPRRHGVAGWGDAATIVPWNSYLVYGDTAILHKQYESMKAWVDYIQANSKNDYWSANGYGDWLAPGDSTSLPYIDQCFWAYSTQLVVHAAQVLGQTADQAKYGDMLQRVKDAFMKAYIHPDGSTMPNTQTSYVLALEFDLLPDSLRKPAAARLAALIKANNNHLATGFLGTPFLLHALSNNGYTGVAYDVLQQDTYPSWLYPVRMGATTIWEKWNAILPDSTVQATSYNHYSYGAVGDWLYRTVAGIDAAQPGYRHIRIAPQPGGGITWVRASYNCPYGKIVSNWKKEGDKLQMEVEIPTGTTATVIIPGKAPVEIKEGRYTFEGVYQPSGGG